MFHRPRALGITVPVGMDLDGVNYMFERSYFDTLVALGEIRDRYEVWSSEDLHDPTKPPVHEFREAGTWMFFEAYGHDYDQFNAFCDRGADLGIIFGPQAVAPVAKSAWNDLLEDGCELHVKTNRFFGSHPAVSHANTRTWLKTEGLRYHSLTFCKDKLEGPECDMFLEDNVDNYDRLDAAGVEVWLIDRSWNQDEPGGPERRRVYSHDEFVTRVRAFAKRKWEQQQDDASDPRECDAA